jgi:acylphosphatase
VQGVGFRYFTRQAAKQVGVTGWVKNRIDGTVEALARGNAEQLKLFENELNQGPSFSYVDRVQRLETEESEGDFIHQFIIRH